MKNLAETNHFKLPFVVTIFLFLTTLSCAKDYYEFIEISEYSDTVLDTTDKKRISNLFQIIMSEKATIHQVIRELKSEKQIFNSSIEDNSTQYLFIVIKRAARRNDTLDGFQNYLRSQNIELTVLLNDFQINCLYKNVRKNTFLGYVDSLSTAL